MVVSFTNSAYVGDVSALCFVSWTCSKKDSVTRELTFLAGVGGHLLWYHIESGRLLNSCSIFSGIRIHGIHGPANGETFPHTWDQAERGLEESVEERTDVAPSQQGEGEAERKQLVVVFGERKLRVIGVCPAHSYDQEEELEVLSSLPRLSHWILDARLLYDDWPVREEGTMWPPSLAVGLTNNTVEIWEWSVPCRVLQVACSGKAVFAVFAKFMGYLFRVTESCWWDHIQQGLHRRSLGAYQLLNHVGIPHMEMVCSSFLILIVEVLAAQVQIWKVTGSHGGGCVAAALAASQLDQHTLGKEPPTQGGVLDCTASDARTITSHLEGSCKLHQGALFKRASSCMTRTAVPLHHLEGHEGSIHRLSWSSDGRLLGSASDDRSARIWRFSGSQSEAPSCEPGAALFGHSARLWDCEVNEQITVTVSEDCTCRVWTPSGNLLRIIRGHHKAEYVRCLALASFHILYVATNLGLLHRYTVATAQWATVVPALLEAGRGPIVTMDVLNGCYEHKLLAAPARRDFCSMEDAALGSLAYPGEANEGGAAIHTIAYGDGMGYATAVCMSAEAAIQIIWSCRWQSYGQRQLLGTFFCRKAGNRTVFTTDPFGTLTWWALERLIMSEEEKTVQRHPLLTAIKAFTFSSPFGARILCLDLCKNKELLVCGDQKSNILVFSCPAAELANSLPTLVAISKAAHGISAILSVAISENICDVEKINISSTGRDGCICHHVHYSRARSTEKPATMTCIRVEPVPGITVVEAVVTKQGMPESEENDHERMAVGFSASDFLIWSLSSQLEVVIDTQWFLVKLLRVPCGGWNRPHSVIVDNLQAFRYCFAYLKDQKIYIHCEVPKSPNQEACYGGQVVHPRSFQLQYHGREIHTASFIRPPARQSTQGSGQLQMSYILTGSEDGTVRTIKYVAGARTSQQKLRSAEVLGELAGGAPVRASAVATEIGQVVDGSVVPLYTTPSADGQAIRPSVITVTAGAKEGMACWSHEWVQVAEEDVGLLMAEVNPLSKSRPCQLVSGWVSTFRPARLRTSLILKVEGALVDDLHASLDGGSSHKGGNAVKEGGSGFEGQELPPIHSAPNTRQEQNDQRIMAITAFSFGSIQSRSLIVYIVAAVSDAQLRLHVFHAATDTWHLLAVLCHHAAPVLSLAHVIYSKKKHKVLNRQPLEDVLEGHRLEDLAFIVCSGATDGAAAIWDITPSVKFFLLNTESFVSEPPTSARLPLRGRGSQGGSQSKASRTRRTLWQRQHLEDVHGDDMSKQLQSHQGGIPLSRPAQTVAKTSVQLPDSSENKGCCKQSAISCTQGSIDAPATDAGLECTQELVSINRVPGAAEVGCPTSSAKTGRCVTVTVLRPVLVLYSIHQSGINSLSMAPTHWSLSCKQLNNQQQDGLMTPGGQLTLVTGGDDQAIHLAVLQVNCDMASQAAPQGQEVHCLLLEAGLDPQQMVVHCIHRRLLANAHLSSVKGVWTDGRLAFSAGLDQRLRCWHLRHVLMSSLGEAEHQATSAALLTSKILLEEITSCVLDVPDIGGLDAEPAGYLLYPAVKIIGLRLLAEDYKFLLSPLTDVCM
eukprot:SM000007S20971  [mRNA]  locus=s7:1205704:1215143:- [translate_table: standard]